MICYPRLGFDGRLGNQLFQYAALRGLSLKHGYEAKIPDLLRMAWHGQNCQLYNFNLSATMITEDDMGSITNVYREPDHTKVDAAFFEQPDGTAISGFFQSLKYFEDYKDQIFKELTPHTSFLEDANTYMNQFGNKTTVSVHVRRGDNTDGTNPEMMGMYNSDGYYFKYLKEAVKQFEDCQFLVFTGGSREGDDNSEDVQWCRDNLGIDAHYSNGNTMEDFSRILSCDHSILGQASSFGLFAGYLNVEKGKRVIAPAIYDPTSTDTHEKREGLYHKDFEVLCK